MQVVDHLALTCSPVPPRASVLAGRLATVSAWATAGAGGSEHGAVTQRRKSPTYSERGSQKHYFLFSSGATWGGYIGLLK